MASGFAAPPMIIRRRQRQPRGIGALPMIVMLSFGGCGGAYLGHSLQAFTQAALVEAVGIGRPAPTYSRPSVISIPINMN